MAGIISIPTAAVVAGPDPEIAPKNRQASTVALARPPVAGPAKASATFTNRFEIPEYSIRAPARINAGNAMIGKESTEVYATCTR